MNMKLESLGILSSHVLIQLLIKMIINIISQKKLVTLYVNLNF